VLARSIQARFRRALILRIAVILWSDLVVVSLVVAQDDGWKKESDEKGVVIHSRLRQGSPLKEFRGVGLIEANPETVFAVIDDTESYTHFMPYTAEVRMLKREKNSATVYQRLALPLISDRDYTIVSKHDTWSGPDGPIHRVHWESANNLGPAPKSGVIRVNLCEGGWLLEPNGANATRATYIIYTDSGGAIPAFIANSGSRLAIRKLFEAVRKQVKEPKYAAARN
jgi:hypothetical protein